jgi:uncharacterized membrane protein
MDPATRRITMNMTIKHIVAMLGVGAVVGAVLVAFGLPLTTALLFAFILACPLMMVWMMFGMGGSGMNHGGSVRTSQDQEAKSDGNTHVHS